MEQTTRKKKHLMSCDACRYRRIKCVRNSLDEVCQECEKRGFNCSSEHIKKRKPAPRSGKRLEAIKSFGQRSGLSEFSSEGQLITHSLSKQLKKHLFEVYLKHTHIHIPTGHWSKYYQTFIHHDCELEFMSPDIALVCLAAIAMGSRWSGSEAVLGTNMSSESPFSDNEQKLSTWGERRHEFCINLANRAIEYCDAKSVPKIISAHSLRALLLLYDLCSYMPEKQDMLHLYLAPIVALLRVYNKAYSIGKLSAQEAAQAHDVDGGKLWIFSYYYDSELSCRSGHTPLMNDSDIKLSQREYFLLTTSRVRNTILNGSPWDVAEVGLVGIVYRIASMNIFTNDHITNDFATQSSGIDAGSVEKFIKLLDENIELLNLFYERTRVLFPLRFVIAFHWVHNLMSALTLSVKIVQKVLQEAQSKAVVQSQQITLLLSEIDYRMFMLARKLCHRLHMSQGKLALGGLHMIDLVADMGELILNTPSTEEAGPIDFSAREKNACLDVIQMTLYRNSWAWSHAGQRAKEFEAKRGQLFFTTVDLQNHFQTRQFTTADYNHEDLWSAPMLVFGSEKSLEDKAFMTAIKFTRATCVDSEKFVIDNEVVRTVRGQKVEEMCANYQKGTDLPVAITSGTGASTSSGSGGSNSNSDHSSQASPASSTGMLTGPSNLPFVNTSAELRTDRLKPSGAYISEVPEPSSYVPSPVTAPTTSSSSSYLPMPNNNHQSQHSQHFQQEHEQQSSQSAQQQQTQQQQQPQQQQQQQQQQQASTNDSDPLLGLAYGMAVFSEENMVQQGVQTSMIGADESTWLFDFMKDIPNSTSGNLLETNKYPSQSSPFANEAESYEEFVQRQQQFPF